MFEATSKAIDNVMANVTDEEIEQAALKNRKVVAQEQAGSAAEVTADELLNRLKTMFADGSINDTSQPALIKLCTSMVEKTAGRKVALAAAANMRKMSKAQLIATLQNAMAKADKQFAKQQG
jgi:hypothetical protein